MSDTTQKQIEKIIIIGGGPAGLAAAVYNARAGLNPLVFAGSPPGGQLTLTSEVENFPGHEGIMGPELVDKIRKQAIKFGTRVIDQNITSVDFTSAPFKVSTYKETYVAKTVLIATGAQAIWLGLESEQRLRGKGVSACATCDGFFFKGKDVAIIGGGDTAMEEALTLTKFATKVYVIHRRDSFRASKIMQERVLNHPQIEVVWNAEVTEVTGENKVEGITLKVNSKDERKIVLNGVFLAIGHKPDTALFKDKIDLDKKGYIMTSAMKALEFASFPDVSDIKKFDLTYQTMTSVPGVFAAGDCVDHVYRQAATAAGMGVAASLDLERYLELK
jgi:thioredoxin reductase (NADPH)